MRYDWRYPVKAEKFSREFYEEIDRRFFGDAERLPARKRPFDQIIPFDILPNLDVLEIGVGNGSHAQLLAPHCGNYTGIDITEYAATSTSKRFEIFGLKGAIRRMDAEAMEFPDRFFDFIWTWGVIHHSANTAQVLSEMHRVLHRRSGYRHGVSPQPSFISTSSPHFSAVYLRAATLRPVPCISWFSGIPMVHWPAITFLMSGFR